MDDAAWQAGSVRTLGMLLSGTAIQEVDERGEQITGDTVLVLLNGHTDTVTFTLPPVEDSQPWRRVVDTFEPLSVERRVQAGVGYPLRGRSVAVFKILNPRHERRRRSDMEATVATEPATVEA